MNSFDIDGRRAGDEDRVRKAEKVTTYRKKAAELRETAKTMSATGRDELLIISQYDELAAKIEAEQRG